MLRPKWSWKLLLLQIRNLLCCCVILEIFFKIIFWDTRWIWICPELNKTICTINRTSRIPWYFYSYRPGDRYQFWYRLYNWILLSTVVRTQSFLKYPTKSPTRCHDSNSYLARELLLSIIVIFTYGNQYLKQCVCTWRPFVLMRMVIHLGPYPDPAPNPTDCLPRSCSTIEARLESKWCCTVPSPEAHISHSPWKVCKLLQ